MVAKDWEEWERLMDEFDAKWELIKPERTVPYSEWYKKMIEWSKDKYSDENIPKIPNS